MEVTFQDYQNRQGRVTVNDDPSTIDLIEAIAQRLVSLIFLNFGGSLKSLNGNSANKLSSVNGKLPQTLLGSYASAEKFSRSPT
uniref:Uncharacterized protein n=1 Tax=Ditylenchus dipsaci TaxID=166011 RepID=A0A915E6D9_9BILA